MPQKQGELRVQKSGVIYGPMTREAFDGLLVDGKIDRSDLISVRGGEWTEIASFLLAPADDQQDATLRLLAGQRMYSSLSRREVEQLRTASRAGDDDLICALNGPWMRVGDFFAPPSAPCRPTAATTPDAPFKELADELKVLPEEAPQHPLPQAVAAPRADRLPDPVFTTAPTGAPVAPPVLITPPAAGSLAPLPLVSMGRAAYPSPPPALPPGVWLSDVWFVRVRGMHSAPLKKHHVRTLFEARELTADSPARNENWPENAWSPIYLIPELADVAA